MRQLLLLILVLVFFDLAVFPEFILHCPDKAIKAEAGQNVTLWCSVNSTMKPDKVEWTVNGSDCDVHFFLDGKVDLDHQCEEYRGKTSLFPDELSSWNSSLMLMTQLSHSGRYCCSVRVGQPTQYCCISLTVSPPRVRDTVKDKTKGNPTAVDPPGNSNTLIIIGIGGVVVLVIVSGVVLYLRRKCTREPMNRIDMEEMVGVADGNV